MPTLTKRRRCKIKWCKSTNVFENYLCDKHGGANYCRKTDYRITRTRANSSRQWQGIRKYEISSQIFCQSCLLQDRHTVATVVDHLFQWMKIGEHAFKRNIFQALCIRCNQSKTTLEHKGIMRYYDIKNKKHIDYQLHDYEHVVGAIFE